MTIITTHLNAQSGETKPDSVARIKTGFAGYDGTIIGGYVNGGGFINFMGPNLNFSIKKHRIVIGMLPSLRFKEDNSTPRNSLVMPTLGVGITYSWRFLAIQVPLYYSPKTAAADGSWDIGVGAGLRINEFIKKKKKQHEKI